MVLNDSLGLPALSHKAGMDHFSPPGEGGSGKDILAAQGMYFPDLPDPGGVEWHSLITVLSTEPNFYSCPRAGISRTILPICVGISRTTTAYLCGNIRDHHIDREYLF